MKIIKFEESMIEAIVNLWNQEVSNTEIYKPFTVESFQDKFTQNLFIIKKEV